MTESTRIAFFRQRLASGETSIGTFQKIPNAAVTEILALSGLDCVCIDAEHAPFDRAAIDTAILAARAYDLPSLIRIPESRPVHILNALDLGATGIVVPHVTSAAHAREIVALSRYGRGGRGYSGTPRSSGYATRTMPDIIASASSTPCVVAQIEDEAALGRVAEIAAVDGVDCLFIGRMDLTVSMGMSSPDDPAVIEAVRSICTTGRRHGRCIGMFTATYAEALYWREEGASLFLLGSDQQWVLQGARDLISGLRTKTPREVGPRDLS